jgi:hypothetical protein
MQTHGTHLSESSIVRMHSAGEASVNGGQAAPGACQMAGKPR